MIGFGRYKGIVFEYNVLKGFGFISIIHKIDGSCEDFKDVSNSLDQIFIHYKCIEVNKEGFKKLLVDQVVEFEICKSDRGFFASDLTIIGEGSEIPEFKKFTQYNNINENTNFNQEKYNT